LHENRCSFLISEPDISGEGNCVLPQHLATTDSEMKRSGIELSNKRTECNLFTGFSQINSLQDCRHQLQDRTSEMEQDRMKLEYVRTVDRFAPARPARKTHERVLIPAISGSSLYFI